MKMAAAAKTAAATDNATKPAAKTAAAADNATTVVAGAAIVAMVSALAF